MEAYAAEMSAEAALTRRATSKAEQELAAKEKVRYTPVVAVTTREAYALFTATSGVS